MAKPKAKTAANRRQALEQMRREQQLRERRRTLGIVAASAVVALGIVGAVAVPMLLDSLDDATPLTELGVPAAAARCSPVSSTDASGTGVHRPPGQSIRYEQTPPAFGPHWGTQPAFDRTFYTPDDRPPVEQLVHNLEHGYTILWYDETLAGDDVLAEMADRFDTSPGGDKFIVAPWTESDGPPLPAGKHLALTHWSAEVTDAGTLGPQRGRTQLCAAPSGAVVQQFVDRFPPTDSPEPATP